MHGSPNISYNPCGGAGRRCRGRLPDEPSMDMPTSDFVRAGSLEELEGHGPAGRARPPSPDPSRARPRARVRARQSLPAHGFPARSRQRRGRHPHLPLASRALRAGERMHLRSMGGRRADLPGRDPCRRRDLGEAGVRLCRPGRTLASRGSPTGSPTISASSSPRPCTVSSRRAGRPRRWCGKPRCSAPATAMAGAAGSPS